MKLKYYLRGIGVGILVTTLILTIAGHNRKKMSDEEVIKRAGQLGMIMQKDETLFDNESSASETEASTTETPTTETPTTEASTTEAPTTEAPTTEAPTTEAPTTEAPTTEAPTTAVSGNATIQVVRGMYSESVSQAMQSAGIISDWRDFNMYLCSNGYAERLQTGTFTMNSSMSYEQLAKILIGAN